MTNDTHPIKSEFGQITESGKFIKNIFRLQTDLRILLLMPVDLLDLIAEPLKKRVKKFGISLIVASPDFVPRDLNTFDRLLSFSCPLPSNLSPDIEKVKKKNLKKNNSSSKIFIVNGAHVGDYKEHFLINEIFSTSLEKRYIRLQASIKANEYNEQFIRLAKFQDEMQVNLLHLQNKKSGSNELLEKIYTVDDTYYHILGYFLDEAVDTVSQLVTLGDVIKKYVKILIIDDTGERVRDKLEEKGYRKRFVTTISLHQLNQSFKEFKYKYQNENPGEEVTHQDFFSKCTAFDEHEIVIYNPWKIKDGCLPIQIWLKRHPDLTRKELRKLNTDPEIRANEVNMIVQEQLKLQCWLKAAEGDLHNAETGKKISESEYVLLNKRRKRILKDLNKKAEQLKEIQKEISADVDLTKYSRDFIEAAKDRHTSKKIIRHVFSQQLYTEHQQSDEILSLTKLENMATFVKQKTESDHQIRQLNKKIKSIIELMEEFASKDMLIPKQKYQQVLGTHILDKLEMSIIGCGMAKMNRFLHISQGPYFIKIKNQSTVIDWRNELVSQSSIYIATKTLSIDTKPLQKFFRIPIGETSTRIEISPVLPNKAVFKNSKYDLVILDYGAYSFSEIAECLQVPNRSKLSSVPVLIIDADNYLDAAGKGGVMNLLVGLKKTSTNTITMDTPPYKLQSLQEIEILYPMLCDVLGIEPNSVPIFTEDVQDIKKRQTEEFQEDKVICLECDDNKESNLEEIGLPRIAEKAEFDEQLIANVSPNDKALGKIDVADFNQDEEEIYTLGSIFSFDDQSSLPLPAGSGKDNNTRPTDSKTIVPTKMDQNEPLVDSENDIESSERPETEPDQSETELDTDDSYESSHLF